MARAHTHTHTHTAAQGLQHRAAAITLPQAALKGSWRHPAAKLLRTWMAIMRLLVVYFRASSSL
jgi:hypothetical protein